jgi:lipopolysaccharide/colanic/teichoic acid biosynthesis glycosyltransferase
LIFKRLFDFFSALSGLLVFGVVILVCVILATIDTKSFGLFIQKRIGQHGKPFAIFKIKTLNDKTKTSSCFGNFLRSSKLDELPQLFNILNGTMSFVGPRPDISGYADALTGDDKEVLNVRPGVTGIASIKYRNEEQLLSQQPNPLHYNDNVIWPDKVSINKWYVQNQSFLLDLKILFYTIIPSSFNPENFMKTNTISK